MRERLSADLERTEIYAKIVAVLKAEQAKPINTRLADKVEKALQEIDADDYEVRIVRQYGMTNLEYGGYGRTQGNRGGSILLAHSEKSVPIADRYIESMESHLAAKHRRNAARQALLDSPLPEEIDRLVATVAAVSRRFEEIHDGDNGEQERWAVLPSFRSLIDEALGG